MADGNLGSLFVSLGIKDEMSNALRKIVKEMNGVDQATLDAKKRGEELVNSLNNINGTNFSKVFREANEYIEKNTKGVSGIVKMLNQLKNKDLSALTGKFLGSSDLTKLASILRTANSEFAKMTQNEEMADRVKIWQGRISNALDYIKLLQDIDAQQRKISNTKAENPNVDTKSLDNARKSIAGIKSEIASILSNGGVDDSSVLGGFRKLLTVAKNDVKEIVATFKKDNPFSAFTGGAAKVEADIARVTEKLGGLRDKMSEGFSKGFKTSMLTDSITGLDNVLSRLQAAKLNPTMLTDAAQMRNLISDVLVEMTKATAAASAYRREREKTVAIEKGTNKIAAAERQQNEALTRAEMMLRNIDALTSRSYELKVDTSTIAQAKQMVVELQQKIGSFSGESLLSNDFKDLLSNLREAKVGVNQLLKEQSEANRKASDSLSKTTNEANRIASAARAQREAITRMDVILRNIDNITKESKSLKVDTTNIEEAKKALSDIYQNMDKMSGKQLISNDFKDLLSNLREAKIGVNQLLKEQSAANRKAKEAIDAQKDSQKRANSEVNKAEIAYNNLKNTISRAIKAYGTGIKLFDDKSEIDNIRHALSLLTTLRSNLQAIKDSQTGVHPVLGVSASQYLSSAEFVNTLNNAKLAISEQEKQNSTQERINRSKQRTNGLEDEHAKLLRQSSAAQAQLVKGFERANSHAGKLNSAIQDLKSLFLQGGLVFGAQQFAMSIITTGGEMEKQHIALQSILGDMQNANTMFNQIKELALNSPFTFSELNRDVKQLAAYGVEYDQLYDTTKRLADMSSGLGVSFDRIALAFGQVQARGWLDGKELRQIAYAGIPLLNKLSEFYSKQEGRNVSTSEIKTRISNRDVSFDDVKSIFWQMTNEGGQFYNMQQTLSETLLGRYNKLKDAWEIMLADFANGKNVVGSTFKDIIELVTNLVQNLHTVGPAIAAVFSGPLLKKGLVAMEGGLGKSILTSKANVASDITSRVMQGQKISNVEKQILATKNQITLADIRNLAKANALTKAELQRLYISGRITKEMYQQGMALTKQVAQSKQLNLWGAMKNIFSGSGIGAVGGLIGKGLMSGLSSIVSFFGGLPGIAITAATTIFAYWHQKNAQLKQEMETTADELKDRYTQISEFLRDNDADKALNDGDEKNIENLIDAYKEKLKEIAPEKANAFEMSLTEKKSNEDRLRYLKQQLELLKKIEAESNKKLSDEGTYKGFDSVLSHAKDVSESYASASAKTNAVNATQSDFAAFQAWSERYKREVNSLKSYITDTLGDISKDPKLQGEANQIMSSFFSKQGWDQNVADQFRADVLNSMGVETNFYEEKFKSALENAVNTTYPWIGDKIRNNQELTDAEKVQVNNLMKDAAAQVERDYPLASDALKRMLAADRFEAVIHLVFDKQESDLVKQLGKNLKGDGYDYHEKNKIVGSWGKDAGDSYNKAKSNAQSDITATKKELDDRRRMLRLGNLTLDEFNKTQKQYELKVSAYRDEWGETFTGDEKKSGRKKGGRKNNGGRHEDTELKALQERLSSLKSARQMYQKYQPYMTDEEAKKKTLESFPEVTGLNLDNYQEAVRALLKGFKINTTERKKFQTSVYREVAEWLFDEKDKKAFEEKAATFTEELNRLSSQWDLYRELLQKTGSDSFAQSAFSESGFLVDEKAKELMTDYKNKYGEDFGESGLMYLTDGEAKKSLRGPGQYEAWKKITELLRNNYVQSLQDGADAMQQTMSMAQKMDSITYKYNEKRKKANGDQGLIDRYSYLEKQEKSGILFDQLKSEINWDGVFGSLDNYTKKELRKIRKQIRDLVAGGILDGMSTTDLKSFYDGMEKLNQAIDGQGFSGLSDLIKEMVDASQKYDEATKEYNEAVAKYGKNSWQAEAARKKMQEAEDRKRRTTGSVRTKKETRLNNILTVADMFKTLGMSNGSGSTFLQNAGGWTESLMKMFGGDKAQKNSQKIGSIVGMFAGLTEAINEKGFGGFLSDAFEDISGATNSIFKDLFGINLGIKGADYSDYNKAKAEYENLVNIWDTLISKKKTYLSEHWGTEAQNASKEAMALLKSEIEQTKVIAQNRLGSGASIGSHSIGYRMWKGSYKYNDQNWKDVAGEISSKYGVQFNGMEDMLNMAPKVLEGIKTDYSGLWANMDSDFRDYLDKLIEYGDQVDEMEENITEKLTGNKFSDLVSSWGDAMASMANSSDSLVDHFEDNLKKTILNSMIENIYGDKIKALIAKTKEYAENKDKITDSNGKTISEYTGAEYADVKESTDDLAKQIEATRDFLKKTYGWSDNSSSSSTNSVKGITEETADIIVSYINSMRLDLSVNREELKTLSDFIQEKLPELSVIAQSQLTQLNQISQNTLRNADSAERIESMLNSVINGVKRIRVV